MEQKTIWIRYFFIGIAISSFFLSASCKKHTQWVQHAEFNYVNQTNYTITFPKGYSNTYLKEAVNVIIKPNTTTVFKVTFGANKEVTADSYVNNGTPFSFTEIYKVIFFDNTKCLDLSKLTINNPSDLKNYVAERIDKRTFKFTYTFSEADYNRAITCP